MSKPLVQLTALGQSPWYDFITRDLVHSGELARLVREEGLRGMTSNPTIFEKAITGSSDYDADMKALGQKKPAEIVEALMIADVQAACDVFRPLYDAAGNGDGAVSIEVAPTLAHDTTGTITEAERLWERVARPNVMIKVPGTKAGLPAITHLIARGINVNITLLFSVARYREVIDAFSDGLMARIAKGLPIDGIHSVASFFVSRVDGMTDKALAGGGKKQKAGKRLLHKIAIANALDAYGVFRESLETDRWKTLAKHGAHVQRPLWASTSTKDPSLPDTYYVDALIAPETVNTIPPATWDAYADHGKPEIRITDETIAAARAELAAYAQLDVPSLEAITKELEDEGVEKFAASWNELLGAVRKQVEALSKAG
ncbi:MAG: transaldolase [Gemmatimonadota bacterium]